MKTEHRNFVTAPVVEMLPLTAAKLESTASSRRKVQELSTMPHQEAKITSIVDRFRTNRPAGY